MKSSAFSILIWLLTVNSIFGQTEKFEDEIEYNTSVLNQFNGLQNQINQVNDKLRFHDQMNWFYIGLLSILVILAISILALLLKVATMRRTSYVSGTAKERFLEDKSSNKVRVLNDYRDEANYETL